MRVYYISSGLQGCYYYRCLLPLQANGWDGDQTSINPETKTPENKAEAAQQADVVVFHRPDDENKLKLARLLKQQGKKIVYDNDDTYKDDNGFKVNAMLDEERMQRRMKSMGETLDAFIKEADLVTCTTEYLADEYRKINPNVTVVPNCIDPFMFDEPLRNDTGTFRVGFTGSVGCTLDFEHAVRIVEKAPWAQWVMYSLPNKENGKIYEKLYHDEYKILETLPIEWHAFTPFHEYYETLNELRLDAMVIPRNETPFNKAKSNLKFLEASMLQIPVVAQAFSDGMSPYEVDPEDAKHVLLARTTDEFVQHLAFLRDNPDKRIEMGKRAQEYVANKYDINNNFHVWEQTYQNLFQRIQ
jgi:glycosyltransferase involved in cell wall biosynthesis